MQQHKQQPLSKNVHTIKDFENSLNFILNHFDQDRLFPRTIMTKKLGYQKEVFSKEIALQHFKEADFIDCRINAFPSFTNYKGIQRYPPDFIFIDIDKNNFTTERSFKLAFSNTLKNIKEKLGVYSTVLFTGGGYHIYQPIDAFVLEDIDIFNKFENPSNKFFRFAKDYLSNNKADKSNNPSFKSCLLRIPSSLNSKFFSNEESKKNSQVKIIQEWNRNRPSIKYLLRNFRCYLIDQKIKEWKTQQKIVKRFSHQRYQQNNSMNPNVNTISWIEILLKTPITDFRKNATNLILAPYLVNIKKIPYQESFDNLIEWLKKCDLLKKLDFNTNYLVKSALNIASEKGIPPMKLETLKNRDLELYLELYNQRDKLLR